MSSASLSSLSIRERVTRYYQAYAPESMSKIDTALESYKGHEERLMQDLVKKYGKPEPPLSAAPAVDGAEPAATGGGVSSPSVEAQSALSSPPTGVGVADHSSYIPLSPPQGLPPLASSPLRHSASSRRSTPGIASPSVFATSPSFGVFGSAEISDGDDDAVSLTAQQQQQQMAAAVPVDPYAPLRQKITTEVGFIHPTLKREWEDAWLGKIPLGNYVKQWGEVVIHKGSGWKLSAQPKAGLQRWQRRYFVLVPSFLYYFDNDEPMSPCKGAIYLDRAKIVEKEQAKRKAIVITPRVHKKPIEMVSDGDFSDFTIAFDSKKVQDAWVELLTKVSVIVPPSLMASASDSSAPLQQQQQAVAAPTTAPTPPHRYASSSALPIRTKSPGSTSSFRLPVSSGNFAGVSPSPAFHSGSSGGGFDGVAPSPRGRAALDGTRTLAEPSVAADTTVTAAAPTATAALQVIQSPHQAAAAAEDHRRLLAHQHHLQEMLLHAQQQQNELMYRNQLQQEAAKIKQTLHVDEADLKRRIAKVAAEKDAAAVADAMLSFVMDSVTDLNSLWKLMSSLDDLPRRQQTAAAAPPPPPPAPAPTNAAFVSAAVSSQSAGTAPQASAAPSPDPALLNEFHAFLLHQQLQQQQSLGLAASSNTVSNPTLSSVSEQIAIAQQQRRQEEMEAQRRRIQDNFLVAAAMGSGVVPRGSSGGAAQSPHLTQQHTFGYHSHSTTPVRLSGALPDAAAPRQQPSHSSPANLYSPSAGLTVSSLPAFYTGSQHAAPTVSNSDDAAWQDRLARMKQRKRAMEGILNDLPSH